MSDQSEDLRIGQLLTRFGLTKQSQLEMALSLAEETRLPVGRLLVLLDHVSEDSLRVVLKLQSLLKDRQITSDQAGKIVQLIKEKQISFEQGLSEIGCGHVDTPTNKLGELLVASQHVSESVVENALETSNITGLPLGRVLVLGGQLPEPMLAVALTLQEDIRSGKVDRDMGMAKFRIARMKKRGQEVSQTFRKARIRLGELLVMAKILSETDVNSACEMANANEKMIGEVMTEFSWIDEDFLAAALDVQQLVWAGQLTLEEAIPILQDVHKTGNSLENVMQKHGHLPSEFLQKLTLFDFLQLTGFMTKVRLRTMIKELNSNPKLIALIAERSKLPANYTEQALKEAVRQSIKNSAVLREILIKANLADPAVIEDAESLTSLVRSGILRVDQSIIVFSKCLDGKQKVADAMKEIAGSA